MKLSKQERIAAVVILVIVILAVGIFMFIKPRVETISNSMKSLETKQQELLADQQKASKKDELKTQVLDAFEEGENLADMFFEEMTAYQAEEEFRNFLEQCGANVIVNEVSVTDPTTAVLAPTFFEEKPVVYPLKTYATAGVDPTEEELAAASRAEILRSTLGGSQQVGATTVSFSVTALDHEEFIKFCDAVNNYEKKEAGGTTRKACMLSGFVFDYPLVSAGYDELKDEIAADAQEEGLRQLYKKFNKTMPADLISQREENQEEEELNITDYIYTVDTSITFYSVARMQDPTDQLDAQDGIAF